MLEEKYKNRTHTIRHREVHVGIQRHEHTRSSEVNQGIWLEINYDKSGTDNGIQTITDFSDIPAEPTTFTAFTQTFAGVGDHTPTQWLTDTRNPNDVPLQTAQADDAKRVGVPLGFAAAAVLGLL